MDEDVDYGLQLAYLDLESARRSLQGESFLHCLFGCQQALEKLLKGMIVEKLNQAPPRVHNLIRLSTLADIALKPEHESLLSKLSLEYTEMRYPGELATIAELNNSSAAVRHLQQTEELFQWLEAQRK